MPRLAPGTLLGPYAVQALLDRGGMGEVYRATDTRDGRIVAIKVLADDAGSDPVVHQRFEREVRLVSRLNHAHICAVLDVGSQSGIQFLVMEFLEGESLELRLVRGPLKVKDAVKCAAEIADGLTAAHGHGIVHRDIKPGNIMMTPSGAKLLDFGLAKPWLPALMPVLPGDVTADDYSLTNDGAVLGTVAYLSPEQIERREVTASADLFALGAVLYEMVTGRRAFPGGTVEQIVLNVLSNKRPSVRREWRHVARELDGLVGKCLALRSEDRWQSAAALRDALLKIQ